MEIAEKGYMTQKEVAAVLGVSPSTVRNMIKDGRIRGVVLSKRPMISSAAVRRLLEQGDDPGHEFQATASAPRQPPSAGPRPGRDPRTQYRLSSGLSDHRCQPRRHRNLLVSIAWAM